MDSGYRLLGLLQDGAVHSGAALGRALGVSRAAVWKIVHGLQASGVAIEAIGGRGYCWRQPVDLLEADRIRSGLSTEAAGLGLDIQVVGSIVSTNAWCMERARAGAASGTALLAESQNAGRGRRGRAWVSPPASQVCLSLLWRYPAPLARLQGLSVRLGIAAVTALAQCGVSGIGLKWPNDLLAGDRKLGGILLEAGGEAEGPCHVVAGIGINVAMPDQAGTAIDQPWTDLSRHAGQTYAGRNRLAAALLESWARALAGFLTEPCDLTAQWAAADLYASRPVTVTGPTSVLHGTARGVDALGRLRLETAAGLLTVESGEVSLRSAS